MAYNAKNIDQEGGTILDIFLYNDLTGTRERFEPLVPGKVSFYVCGPTVYDYFHVGNARPFIVFDVLRRYLEHSGYEVRYVQNFTDIDDKMINRANASGITVEELADRYISAYWEDADALGIKRADANPRATREIEAIIKIISDLVEKGHAYQSDDGVYFSVDSWPDYGKLSKQDIEELKAGARVDVSEHKRSPLDFAIWKSQKPGEPAWESPWGLGRPGWHIECSAMADRYLGATIDIHAGGSDLIFPHHENETAQSEAAHGAPFARFWIHNGYIMINREKMSKSLGNFFTVRDVRARYSAPVIRLFMLQAHYRSPLNFSTETLDQAARAQERLSNGIAELCFALSRADTEDVTDERLRSELADAKALFEECMCDDFNTAGAIGAIFDVIYATNVSLRDARSMDRSALEDARAFLKRADEIMGILEMERHCAGEKNGDDEIDRLIAERNEARKKKDFKRSDEIRDSLAEQGVILEDTPQGTRWKRSL